MKSNKGIGTKEVMIVILLMLSVTAFAMAAILGGADNQKFVTFKENALTFAKTVITNQNSFMNTEVVYLGEAVEEGFIKDIKNSMGRGKCDRENSKVVFKDGHVYTTLKCGKYMIDNYEIKEIEDVPVYEVSEWSEQKPTGEDVEEITLYNCYDANKLVFDQYYEDNYLVFMVNNMYNESARSLDGIERKTVLKVTDKKYYRTKKLIEEKE
jgi:hypothetical protein